MNVAVSQSLVNLLLTSGVPSQEEAQELASNPNGGSWTNRVLDSGKVDEQRFLEAIGAYFKVPVISIDKIKIERQVLWTSSKPVRLPTSYPADRAKG